MRETGRKQHGFTDKRFIPMAQERLVTIKEKVPNHASLSPSQLMTAIVQVDPVKRARSMSKKHYVPKPGTMSRKAMVTLAERLGIQGRVVETEWLQTAARTTLGMVDFATWETGMKSLDLLESRGFRTEQITQGLNLLFLGADKLGQLLDQIETENLYSLPEGWRSEPWGLALLDYHVWKNNAIPGAESIESTLKAMSHVTSKKSSEKASEMVDTVAPAKENLPSSEWKEFAVVETVEPERSGSPSESESVLRDNRAKENEFKEQLMSKLPYPPLRTRQSLGSTRAALAAASKSYKTRPLPRSKSATRKSVVGSKDATPGPVLAKSSVSDAARNDIDGDRSFTRASFSTSAHCDGLWDDLMQGRAGKDEVVKALKADFELRKLQMKSLQTNVDFQGLHYEWDARMDKDSFVEGTKHVSY